MEVIHFSGTLLKRINRVACKIFDDAENARMNSGLELFKSFFWVGLGSALGGIARFAISLFVASRVSGNFPLGTILVNITGSFAI